MLWGTTVGPSVLALLTGSKQRAGSGHNEDHGKAGESKPACSRIYTSILKPLTHLPPLKLPTTARQQGAQSRPAASIKRCMLRHWIQNQALGAGCLLLRSRSLGHWVHALEATAQLPLEVLGAQQHGGALRRRQRCTAHAHARALKPRQLPALRRHADGAHHAQRPAAVL